MEQTLVIYILNAAWTLVVQQIEGGERAVPIIETGVPAVKQATPAPSTPQETNIKIEQQ